MIAVKIARQAYQRGPQTDLATYADNLVVRMSGTAYAPLDAQVRNLASACQRYKDALVAARNRGASEVLAKNLARTELMRHVNELADGLERMSGNNRQLIVDAGFSIRQSNNLRYSRLPAPNILRAFSTGKKGEIRVVLDNLVPSAVRTHAVEYSLDGGNAWINGTYNSRRNFVLEGLPHTPELWVHVKSIGNGANRSDWSAPVAVAVL